VEGVGGTGFSGMGVERETVSRTNETTGTNAANAGNMGAVQRTWKTFGLTRIQERPRIEGSSLKKGTHFGRSLPPYPASSFTGVTYVPVRKVVGFLTID